MRRLRTLALLIAAALFSGCAESILPGRLIEGGTEERLYVASYTRTCTGEGVQECLLVRADPSEQWRYFYDHIEGFTYVAGYEYVLVVSWREVRNPPADGSSRAYSLVRIIEQRRV